MIPDRLQTIGSFFTPAEAHQARLHLAAYDVRAEVVEEMLTGNFWALANATGGVKLMVNASEAERARELLAEQHEQHGRDAARPDWTCAQCRSEVPGTFDVCWSCGTSRNGA